MNRTSAHRLTTTLLAAGLLACGSSDTSTGAGDAATGAGDAKGGAVANGTFEIHLIEELLGTPAHTAVSGEVRDGAPTDMVIWDKKTTEGTCSLYTPRTPFCEACASDEVCVDTNTCRKSPTLYDVGEVRVAGLSSQGGGTGPVILSLASGKYNSSALPYPPCVEGADVRLDASGNVFPAFSIQSKCIAPLVVQSTSVTLESGKPATLTWTPSPATSAARIEVVLDLSHHGGSKGKIICETSDTGSLQVPGALLGSLIALGVTGFPGVTLTRRLVASTTVGAGKADLAIYSDVSLVAQIPGLVSCNLDTDCAPGQTCLFPTLMCGIECTTTADCPTGQTCASTKVCK